MKESIVQMDCVFQWWRMENLLSLSLSLSLSLFPSLLWWICGPSDTGAVDKGRVTDLFTSPVCRGHGGHQAWEEKMEELIHKVFRFSPLRSQSWMQGSSTRPRLSCEATETALVVYMLVMFRFRTTDWLQSCLPFIFPYALAWINSTEHQTVYAREVLQPSREVTDGP